MTSLLTRPTPAPPTPVVHQHRPGTVVMLDPGDLRSTCVDCGTPISRLHLDQDPDLVPRWQSWWKPAPITLP